MSISLREVVVAQFSYQTLCISVKISRKQELLVQHLLEYLVRIRCHERRPSVKQLEQKYSKRVVVNRMRVALVEDDLRSDVFWSSAECKSALSFFKFFYEPKISELDVTILADEHVLGLEVTVDESRRMEVVEAHDDLADVESSVLRLEFLKFI